MNMFGGIEAGGTKFVCAVGTGPDDLHDEIRFETTTPAETLKRVIDYFTAHNSANQLHAIGIGTFGPIDVRPDSPSWGYITTTPKQFWQQTDFAGTLIKAFSVPIGFDTDVNAAALGENTWGAAQGLTDFIYMTIGTGIGGGGMSNGRLLHGMLHPEMGHIMIPHDHKTDPFPGCCPYHKDCFEGLASGPAMRERWDIPAENLPDDHPAWELEADYIARALVNYICTLSPQRIILGGGVMEHTALFPLVREKVSQLLNNYIQTQQIINDIDTYIVPPGLGNRSGILGAIALARQALASPIKH